MGDCRAMVEGCSGRSGGILLKRWFGRTSGLVELLLLLAVTVSCGESPTASLPVTPPAVVQTTTTQPSTTTSQPSPTTEPAPTTEPTTATSMDPWEGLILEDRALTDVTGVIPGSPQGDLVTERLGAVSAELESLFQTKNPGEHILWVGDANRGQEMNAVLTTKYWTYDENPYSRMPSNFLGGTPDVGAEEGVWMGAKGVFLGVLPSGDSEHPRDFYAVLDDPLTGKDFYVKVQSREVDDFATATEQSTVCGVFDLGIPVQYDPWSNYPELTGELTLMIDLLHTHQLQEFSQPGDLVTVFLWRNQRGVQRDERGAQIATYFYVQRFAGVDEILELIRSTR